NGTSTSFDSPSVCTANPGNGGSTLAAGTTAGYVNAGTGGGAPTGDVKMTGSDGFAGYRTSSTVGTGGNGGSAAMGGGVAVGVLTTQAGKVGRNYGSGGSGAFTNGSGAAQLGGAGADGLL